MHANCRPSIASQKFSSIRHARGLVLGIAASLASFNGDISPSYAIGTIDVLKEQSMVIQDIALNVADVDAEANILVALFQNTAKVVCKEGSQRVVAFGPETYKSPKTFIPGVSSFFEDGGHASITLKGALPDKDGNVEIFEKGNGLQQIRIGTEVLRISKAIEAGAKVKYGYGWIELDTVDGLPIQAIVGIRRDPLTALEVRVSSVRDTQKFLSDTLGMKPLSFDKVLSRTKGEIDELLPKHDITSLLNPNPIPSILVDTGSEFEPQAAKGTVAMGYGDDSVALILIQSPVDPKTKKQTPVIIGGQLSAITIVADDDVQSLPASVRDAMDKPGMLLLSPDGYPFKIVSNRAFEQVASHSY